MNALCSVICKLPPPPVDDAITLVTLVMAFNRTDAHLVMRPGIEKCQMAVAPQCKASLTTGHRKQLHATIPYPNVCNVTTQVCACKSAPWVAPTVKANVYPVPTVSASAPPVQLRPIALSVTSCLWTGGPKGGTVFTVGLQGASGVWGRGSVGGVSPGGCSPRGSASSHRSQRSQRSSRGRGVLECNWPGLFLFWIIPGTVLFSISSRDLPKP